MEHGVQGMANGTLHLATCTMHLELHIRNRKL
jgi:hypothetical protein